jgi:D-glycero-D-manno-heptose 1,7-bisphosphate phosphatase
MNQVSQSNQLRSALFLDRDGIINVDKSYVFRFEEIEWVEGIFNLIQFANSQDLLVIVLTNQSGVAQGMYQESDVIELHNQMNHYLKSKNCTVTDWFYCTEYESSCRKPNPGMMIEAQERYNINLYNSYMVGDKSSDVLKIDGPTTFLVKGNYPLGDIDKTEKVEVFDSLTEVLKRLKHDFQS